MKYILLLLSFTFLFACSNKEETTQDTKKVEKKTAKQFPKFSPEFIHEQRAKKDQYFLDSPDSPITKLDKRDFEGLKYYIPTDKYFLTATSTEYDTPDTVTILTSKENDIRKMLKVAKLNFVIDSVEYELQAYLSNSNPEYDFLFIPFSDNSSGKETYYNGRYIEIPYIKGQKEYYLDFNMAYNPYCAYNPKYSCPLVPFENHLDTEIKAGEKKYKELH